MLRAARFRSAIAIGTTFILVSLSFEVSSLIPNDKSTQRWEVWLMWLSAFVFSAFLAQYGTGLLWNIAVGLRYVRRGILGRTWIEGAWFVQTVEYKGDEPAITQFGLAQFSYKLPDLLLEGRVSSVALSTEEPVQTEVISMVLDDELHYMHRFVRHIKDVQVIGVAYGTFLCDDGKPPEHYAGGVIVLGEEETHRRSQTGVKLGNKEVAAHSKDFGIEW